MLRNDELSDSRAFYGVTPSQLVALVSSSRGVGWPNRYQPSIAGIRFVRVDEDKGADRRSPRILGVRLEQVKPVIDDQNDSRLPSAWIVKLTLMNAGGMEPEGAIVQGGCLTTYRVQYNGMAWTAELLSQLDN